MRTLLALVVGCGLVASSVPVSARPHRHVRPPYQGAPFYPYGYGPYAYGYGYGYGTTVYAPVADPVVYAGPPRAWMGVGTFLLGFGEQSDDAQRPGAGAGLRFFGGVPLTGNLGLQAAWAFSWHEPATRDARAHDLPTSFQRLTLGVRWELAGNVWHENATQRPRFRPWVTGDLGLAFLQNDTSAAEPGAVVEVGAGFDVSLSQSVFVGIGSRLLVAGLESSRGTDRELTGLSTELTLTLGF